jgi:2,4-dienoyl-CoA reductase-like NADH-dependent reductase (Old Yellow Enzyme family)
VSDSPLFEAITIRGVRIRNRIWVAPMCQYSAENHDGIATDWHLVHLGAFAQGGAGLVMTEAASVSPEGRISPEDLGIYNDDQTLALQRITTFLHSQGATAAIQLAHAGRKASTFRPWAPTHGSVPEVEGGWPTVAPSTIAYTGYAAPTALSAAGIEKVVADFIAGALRAVSAGFDVIEIHAAHGYLIHQFLSPLSNERDDEYGGSLANRARLLLRVVSGIRAAVGHDVPLIVRFSGTDWTENGWDEAQTAEVSVWAQEAGADIFDISSGGNIAGAQIPVGPGYQVPLASFVKSTAQVRVSAVGLITTPLQAETILREGQADVVMLAREMLRDPHFALRAAHELGTEIDYWPSQFIRARWQG